MNLILANDTSWKGWGWCLASKNGPLQVGHFKTKSTWKWSKLRINLQELDGILKNHSEHTIRVATEKPLFVYSRGNQAATGFGIGQLSGPVMLWGTRPGELLYPWEISVDDWRGWWYSGKNLKRDVWKLWAIRMVSTMGWARFLDDFDYEQDGGGPKGDVAEAILMGVGAAMRPKLAPKGPVKSTDWR